MHSSAGCLDQCLDRSIVALELVYVDLMGAAVKALANASIYVLNMIISQWRGAESYLISIVFDRPAYSVR
jgi:hypothetical protein